MRIYSNDHTHIEQDKPLTKTTGKIYFIVNVGLAY